MIAGSAHYEIKEISYLGREEWSQKYWK